MRPLSASPLCLASLALLTGCASMPAPRPLDAAGVAAVRDQTVAITARPTPDFAALMPGNAVFGLIGGIAAVGSGNKIIADNRVPDPADAIARSLAAALRDTQGSKIVAAPVAVDKGDAGHVAAQAKGKARYVIDVETRVWQLIYFSSDWTHYQVPYTAVARLIDTDTASVLAESTCALKSDTNAGAPTFDEWTARGAARLKASLAASGATCAAQFKRDMLAMRDARPDAAPIAAAAPAATNAVPAAPVVAAAAPASASAQAPAATVNWTGVMACGARQDGGPNAGAYEARFAMEVQGQAVRAYRRTANVEETLAGSIGNDRLELHGSGSRVAAPARKWLLDVGGAFTPDATSYVGKGSMRVDGRALRACELRMTRA